MKAIIDRFEDSYAVCEKPDRTMIKIEKRLIPSEALEGSVIDICDDRITVDLEETEKRKNEIEKLARGLWS